jgi:hypothetical protein
MHISWSISAVHVTFLNSSYFPPFLQFGKSPLSQQIIVIYIEYSTKSFTLLSLVTRIKLQEVVLFPDWLMTCSNECHQPSLHVAAHDTNYHLKAAVKP